MKQKITKQNSILGAQPGFTLIELLVVIAIISLLASVVLVSLNSARAKSRNAKRVADMNQMAKALELFYESAYAYPTGTGAAGAATNYVVANGRELGTAVLQSFRIGTTQVITMTPTFVSRVPSAPTPFDGSCTVNNNRYMYETNSIGSTYTITFCLGEAVGGGQGGLDAGVRYLTPGGFR